MLWTFKLDEKFHQTESQIVNPYPVHILLSINFFLFFFLVDEGREDPSIL